MLRSKNGGDESRDGRIRLRGRPLLEGRTAREECPHCCRRWRYESHVYDRGYSNRPGSQELAWWKNLWADPNVSCLTSPERGSVLSTIGLMAKGCER